MPRSDLPDAPHAPPLLEADLAVCRASLARHSRTFHVASLLLPPRVRASAVVLYGFCRLADDTVDVEGGREQAIAELRQRLDRIYQGRPRPEAAERALAAVVHRHGIPRTLLDWLLEGLAWDVEGLSYDTMADLQDYAARVAGAVGVMMSLLMGVRESAALARASDLGVAMQLSNIARDVAEDARMGRLYLPRQWFREVGLDADAWLREPAMSPEIAALVRRLLDVADALYARAAAGVSALPLDCRPGINAARLMYAAVGHEVARAGFDPFRRRAVVPRRRKLALLGHAALQWRPSATRLHEPVLEACRPLLAAVAAQPLAVDQPRIEWLIDLFARLERQERQPHLDRSAA